jgi:hypothetical protein
VDTEMVHVMMQNFHLTLKSTILAPTFWSFVIYCALWWPFLMLELAKRLEPALVHLL